MKAALNKELIDVDALRVGMFVHLDMNWMSHPFPLSSFRISNPDQVATIRSLGVQRVRWSPTQSDSLTDLAAPGSTEPEADDPDTEVAPVAAADEAVAVAPAPAPTGRSNALRCSSANASSPKPRRIAGSSPTWSSCVRRKHARAPSSWPVRWSTRCLAPASSASACSRKPRATRPRCTR
jgi:hypothetical protein